MIGEGKSINVTLIFSLERYDEVMEAYLAAWRRTLAGGADRPVGVAAWRRSS
jgi:transaldolase